MLEYRREFHSPPCCSEFSLPQPSLRSNLLPTLCLCTLTKLSWHIVRIYWIYTCIYKWTKIVDLSCTWMGFYIALSFLWSFQSRFYYRPNLHFSVGTQARPETCRYPVELGSHINSRHLRVSLSRNRSITDSAGARALPRFLQPRSLKPPIVYVPHLTHNEATGTTRPTTFFTISASDLWNETEYSMHNKFSDRRFIAYPSEESIISTLIELYGQCIKVLVHFRILKKSIFFLHFSTS